MEQKFHVPTLFIDGVIVASCPWAAKILGQQRHRMIEFWISCLETDDSSVEVFIKMPEPVSHPEVQKARVQFQNWKSPLNWQETTAVPSKSSLLAGSSFSVRGEC